MRLRIENPFFFYELSLGIRKDWESDRNESEPKVFTVDFHLYVAIPSISLDKQHINWVKEAWGMMPPKPPKPVVAESQDEDELGYDPIPF